jgi:hypothetical protein
MHLHALRDGGSSMAGQSGRQPLVVPARRGFQQDNSGTNNIQYTIQFGNGVSATIGLDDPTVWDRTNVINLAPNLALNATEGGNNVYAGVHAPDVVGNVRVDQAWGLFQISGVAHEVNASYNSLGLSGSSGSCRFSGVAGRCFGAIGPSGLEMGWRCDGVPADQEHPHRSRRRRQV